MSGKTTVFSPPVGDVVLPIDAQGNVSGNINVAGASVLNGAVSGAGFTAAVKAIAGPGQVISRKTVFLAPLPADLTTVVNAVTPSNVALTIAAQPPQARKLQIRIVIGTTTTTAITAGNLALVGVDQDGNAVTENISLIQNASATLKSANAYATLTSATVSGYAASGSGTGNTVGLGPSNDFGIPCGQGPVGSFALVKATKNTRNVVGSGTAVTTWTNIVADDVASTATIDTAARTVAPTTAPAANGLVDYEFTCSYTLAA